MYVMCVDKNKCKEKEEEKRLTWSRMQACGCELDADDCENKEEEKKRKETLTGCRSWSRMVVDAWNAQMASSGGTVDDSAHVSLYLEIFVRVCTATHITNLLPNISISVKYYTITTQYHPFC